MVLNTAQLSFQFRVPTTRLFAACLLPRIKVLEGEVAGLSGCTWDGKVTYLESGLEISPGIRNEYLPQLLNSLTLCVEEWLACSNITYINTLPLFLDLQALLPLHQPFKILLHSCSQPPSMSFLRVYQQKPFRQSSTSEQPKGLRDRRDPFTSKYWLFVVRIIEVPFYHRH